MVLRCVSHVDQWQVACSSACCNDLSRKAMSYPVLDISLQVVGAQMLAECGMPCNSVLLFSSTSSIWSQPGSSHYSSANTYLDVCANNMQMCGIHALAVQYGPFANVGMASKYVEALVSIGLHPLQPNEV